MKDRIRAIRNISGLSRISVQKMSDNTIRAGSIGKIEDGVSNPSIDMLTTICNFFESKNIFIDYRWLMTGEGTKPYIKEPLMDSLSYNMSSMNEIDFFLKNNPSSLTVNIINNDFSPRFSIGDVIGCIPINEYIFNNDYLLITSLDNQIFKVFTDSKLGIHILYDSACCIQKVIELDQKFPKAYHIVWSRRINI